MAAQKLRPTEEDDAWDRTIGGAAIVLRKRPDVHRTSAPDETHKCTFDNRPR